VIENKQSREIIDSAPIMIPTTYDQDAKRFVSLRETFVSFSGALGVVDARNETASRQAVLVLGRVRSGRAGSWAEKVAQKSSQGLGIVCARKLMRWRVRSPALLASPAGS
jgi:hypothetical protein